MKKYSPRTANTNDKVCSLRRLTEIAEGYDGMVIRLHDVTTELDSLRAWNERVSVCRDHTADVADGECLVCRLAAANALLLDVSRYLDPRRYAEAIKRIQSHLQGAGDEA